MAAADGEKSFVAVFYLDLDRFGLVNDSLGRDMGDKLLAGVERRLRTELQEHEFITRLREDEFLILQRGVGNYQELELVVERIHAALASPFPLKGQPVFVSATIGVALSSHGNSKADDIVRDAEVAMRYAKSKFPGSFEVYNPKMSEGSRIQLNLETELKVALESRQLYLVYEPIVSLESGRVQSVETLIRWNHPERGTVSPLEFISSAENTGLITPITQWVLEETCRQLQEWQQREPPFPSLMVGVNLSPVCIERFDFAAEISRLIEKYGVKSSNLILEITESQLLDHAAQILQSLEILRKLGIKLWIDDFGSGYSSFSYLVRFPIHALKIDQSFIRAFGRDEKSEMIVNAIISLGKSLGVEVIAEGVETHEQLNQLLAMGCPYGQGHYFSKAVEAAAVDDLLRQVLVRRK